MAVDEQWSVGTTPIVPGPLPLALQDRILPSGEEDDLDLFRDRLNSAYYPAFVDAPGHGAILRNARLNAKELNRTTIGFVRFGHEAVVDPGTIDGYHVNVPLAGTIGSLCGTKSVVARPGMAAVFTPLGPTRLPRLSEDAAQVCLKISRRAVTSELEALLGRPLSRPLDVDIRMSLETAAGAQWARAFWSLVDSASAGIPRPVVDYLERALVSQLLFTADHNYADDLAAPANAALPVTLRKVLALIDGAPQTLFTSADLARSAGVGVRRLEQAFREHLGMSPMAYLQRRRYEGAREELTNPAPSETVTTVMYRWGFSNHARFAAGYRRLFGENPSDTLRDLRGA